MAELLRNLTQTQFFAANPQAIELNEPGLVELDRDACAKGVDIVWLAAGRYGTGTIAYTDRSRALATESMAARMLSDFPAGDATS
jgi:hypothetical protein